MMKKRYIMIASILMVLLCLSISAQALAYGHNPQPPRPFSLQYEMTDMIRAELSFDGGKAVCYGVVRPSDSYNCSITVTLYKKNGSGWDYVDSWSGSATGGQQASAGGSASVGSGTYKVVASGNVANKEYPSKSVTKTKN